MKIHSSKCCDDFNRNRNVINSAVNSFAIKIGVGDDIISTRANDNTCLIVFNDNQTEVDFNGTEILLASFVEYFANETTYTKNYYIIQKRTDPRKLLMST